MEKQHLWHEESSDDLAPHHPLPSWPWYWIDKTWTDDQIQAAVDAYMLARYGPPGELREK